MTCQLFAGVFSIHRPDGPLTLTVQHDIALLKLEELGMCSNASSVAKEKLSSDPNIKVLHGD